MNRIILLFVCLGVALLTIHFHNHSPNQPVLSKSAAIAPVNNASVTPTALAEPSVETISVQTGQDPNTQTASETPNISAVEEKNATEEKTTAKDKYEVLRKLREWAARDPEAALAATMKLPEGDERNEALTAVCFGLAQTDPADAVKMAQELRLDKQPAAIMEDLVQQWAATDLTSSLTWAENQPAGAPRDEFTTRIAFVMSQDTPSDAATLVMDKMSPGPAQDEAIMTVLHQWAIQNFAAAANWAKGVAAGPLQERVINELNGIVDHQRAMGQP